VASGCAVRRHREIPRQPRRFPIGGRPRHLLCGVPFRSRGAGGPELHFRAPRRGGTHAGKQHDDGGDFIEGPLDRGLSYHCEARWFSATPGRKDTIPKLQIRSQDAAGRFALLWSPADFGIPCRSETGSRRPGCATGDPLRGDGEAASAAIERMRNGNSLSNILPPRRITGPVTVPICPDLQTGLIDHKCRRTNMRREGTPRMGLFRLFSGSSPGRLPCRRRLSRELVAAAWPVVG